MKDFSASHTALPVRRLGVHGKLGGDTARSADPNWPKGHPTPYDITLNKKNRGNCPGDGSHCSGTDWALVSRW